MDAMEGLEPLIMDLDSQLLAIFKDMPREQKLKAVGVLTDGTQQKEVKNDHKKPDAGRFIKKEDDDHGELDGVTLAETKEPDELNDETYEAEHKGEISFTPAHVKLSIIEDSARENMQRCQSMEEYSKAPGASVYPANYERNEDKSCNGSLSCHSGGEILRQEPEIEWLEPDTIEFAQRRAKLEGKREYEAMKDHGHGAPHEDTEHEDNYVEVNEIQQLNLKTHALFTLDEKYEVLRYGVDICNLCCISEIEAIEEKFEPEITQESSGTIVYAKPSRVKSSAEIETEIIPEIETNHALEALTEANLSARKISVSKMIEHDEQNCIYALESSGSGSNENQQVQQGVLYERIVGFPTIIHTTGLQHEALSMQNYLPSTGQSNDYNEMNSSGHISECAWNDYNESNISGCAWFQYSVGAQESSVGVLATKISGILLRSDIRACYITNTSPRGGELKDPVTRLLWAAHSPVQQITVSSVGAQGTPFSAS